MEPSADLLNQLQAATQGLLWMSESDYPFEVVHWQFPTVTSITANQLLQIIDRPPDTPIEVVDLDSFFATATQTLSWFGANERAQASRYQQLVDLLKQQLQHLIVYRVGSINLAIYILGQTEPGDWVGLKTQAVET
ncbi:nuclease A inhibitor family protein [Pantanalinema rosaneae CENA516]|uniref:nuclease A inhibitor family protein n=1 Tax=Pantanalinema rosaneae TaxID=1620701 RepID=UPI003D6F9B17